MIAKRIILFSLLISFCLFCKAQIISRVNVVISGNKTSVASVDVRLNNMPYCIGLNGSFAEQPDAANNLNVTYYDEFDGQNIGKLKTVGGISFTYYTEFDGFDNIGKLKSIGGISVTYYDRFDGHDTGKIKSIGNSGVTYYTEFDGFDNIGKLKSIGNTSFTYYDRFDGGQPTGQLKSVNGNDPWVNVVAL